MWLCLWRWCCAGAVVATRDGLVLSTPLLLLCVECVRLILCCVCMLWMCRCRYYLFFLSVPLLQNLSKAITTNIRPYAFEVRHYYYLSWLSLLHSSSPCCCTAVLPCRGPEQRRQGQAARVEAAVRRRRHRVHGGVHELPGVPLRGTLPCRSILQCGRAHPRTPRLWCMPG